MQRQDELTDRELIAHMLEVVPDLERVEGLLAPSPGERLADAIEVPEAPGAVPRSRGGRSIFGRAQTIALVGEAAERGLAKVKRDGTQAQLDQEERVGLEAVVSVYGRPALLVEKGHFRPPDPPWEKLEQHRAAIESALRSVGRIELRGHPEYDCVGTGFLVADDVVVTNRHVAKQFLVGPPDWPFEAGITARIDFNEEFLAGEPREFALTEVVAVSPAIDIALLRVGTTNAAGDGLPPPLPLADTLTVAPGSDVYVIGYPLYNPIAGGDPEALHRIFSDLYGIKRLQPGQVRSLEPDKREIVHDCSTLGGNSGSCVIDLQAGQVVGLHRGGRYLRGNFAIALSEVQDDPAIQKAELRFA
jgi:Trypsin-like peptidase domain